MKRYEIRSGFGIEHLTLVDAAVPEPGHGQVLVRVKAASLNYRDLMVVKGLYNPKLKMPRVPCSDGAGEVTAVGPGVTRWQVGDRVAGIFMQKWLAGPITDEAAKSALGGDLDGMLAEQVVLDQTGLVRVPEHLSYEEAATLPCAAVTAWSSLVTHGGVRAGETVLLLGTGGVSVFALQFALLLGARTIITSSSEDKLAHARHLGAHETINYRQNPDWQEKVRELTGGTGVDLVVEVGGAGTLDKSLRAVRVGGQVSLIGVLTGAGAVNPMPVLMKHVRLQGIYVGSREQFEAMNRAIAVHRLKPVVDRVFPFEHAREALGAMEQAGHFGKLVVTVGG